MLIEFVRQKLLNERATDTVREGEGGICTVTKSPLWTVNLAPATRTAQIHLLTERLMMRLTSGHTNRGLNVYMSIPDVRIRDVLWFYSVFLEWYWVVLLWRMQDYISSPWRLIFIIFWLCFCIEILNIYFFEISITCCVRLTECDINENNKQQYKSGSEYLCIIPEPS